MSFRRRSTVYNLRLTEKFEGSGNPGDVSIMEYKLEKNLVVCR